jgi:hypothetical protein
MDVLGQDPKDASCWPGELRDYGRQTDRTRFPRGVDWRIRRSVAIPGGRDGLTVKPSAKPTFGSNPTPATTCGNGP